MAKQTGRNKSVDLGQLQSEFEAATKSYHSAEKALARAQEARNSAKAQAAAADQALRVAAQSVLG